MVVAEIRDKENNRSQGQLRTKQVLLLAVATDGLRGSIPLLVPNRLNIEYLCDKAALMRSPLKTWLVLFSHKDAISNGRCVVPLRKECRSDK